jgi:membrane protease YdiL (CAAX protease family)
MQNLSSIKIKNLSNILVFFFFGIYFIFKYISPESIRFFTYSDYFFEAIFVVLVYLATNTRPNFDFVIRRQLYLLILFAFLFGVFTFAVAQLANFKIPLNFKSFETIVFLVLIGPVIEEFVMRGAFWQLLKLMKLNYKAIIALTAIFFSLSHLYSILFVDMYFYPFIIYQTVYTLILGLWWGYQRHKTLMISDVIYLHIFFNLGFYLSAMI